MLTPVRMGERTAVVDPVGDVSRVRTELWVVLGLTALAAGLRFATLSSQSYWLDEATTVHELRLSFGAMLHAIASYESTPPLYFVLGWVWAKVFGTGEVGLRSLSAFAGTALVPVAYLGGRELVSRRAGALTAAFVALSPFMIWYSQEARSYMLLALFCGASFLFWARSRNQPNNTNISLWALFSSLAVLTHFFAGFLVAPEALCLLWRVRRRAMLAAAAAVAAVQAAVVPLAVGDLGHPLLGWIQRYPLSIRLEQVPADLALSSLYQTPLVSDGLLGAALLGSIVLALLVVAAGRREQAGAGAAAAIAAVALLLPLALVPAGRDYVIPRNFIGVWLPLAVVLAAACTAPRARWAGAALAVVVAGAFVYADVRIGSDTSLQRPDWRGAARALGRLRGPRAIVVYAGSYGAQPLEIYLGHVRFSYTAAPAPEPALTISELDVIGNTYQEIPSRLPAGVRVIARRDVEGLRVVRFALASPWTASTAQIASRAPALLGPAGGSASVLIQR
jgi:mannosyltransferase